MEQALYIIAKTVQLSLSVISSCMFLTVILRFFVNPETSKPYQFVSTVSEFFVFPFRVIMAKLNLFQGLPIDMPFFCAYIFIAILTMILPIL